MTQIENNLIARLSREDRRGLLARCEVVPLRVGEILYPAGERIRHVYFPLRGFISIAAMMGHKPALEVGMVGYEGMLGTSIALGVDTAPYQAMVEADGMARRVDLKSFAGELRRRPGLQRAMQRYIHVVSMQLAGSAACCGLHRLGQRLARRLLMLQDRTGSSTFPVTQEALADHLGVRRGGVSAAAAVLKQRGLINYHRGTVTVVRRRGLEAMSCDCYAVDRQTYAAFLQ